MIVLESRYKIGAYIIIEEDTWRIRQEKVNKMFIQGIGGFTDKHELIGIYIKEKYYFIYNKEKIVDYSGIPIDADVQSLIDNKYIQIISP